MKKCYSSASVNFLAVITMLAFSTSFTMAQDVYAVDEGRVLEYCNLLRRHPRTFLRKVAKPYFKANDMTSQNNKYVRSLTWDLRLYRRSKALISLDGLHDRSHAFAVDMGETGKVGHKSKKLGTLQRRLKGLRLNYRGENCSYGYNTALDIVMQLMIDDGVRSLGHRKNILNRHYTYVGIAIEPHIVYEWNCVMDFGSYKVNTGIWPEIKFPSFARR